MAQQGKNEDQRVNDALEGKSGEWKSEKGNLLRSQLNVSSKE